MRKHVLAVAATLLLAVFLFNGCIKDTVTRSYTYTMYQPVYQKKEAVRTNIRSNTPVAVQQPGKLLVYGPYIFLNEVDKGVHVIDNTDPKNPKNISFIDIPGNIDIAIKGNTLYADLYTDLITIDITDPRSVSLKQVSENVFPRRYYAGTVVIDGTQVIVDSTEMVVNWIVKDTTVTEQYNATAWKNVNRGGVIMLSNCANCAVAFAQSAKAASPVALGGSLARFTIVGERLYTVGNHEGLKIFNISDPMAPAFVNETYIGFAIETIFPFKDKLFIGAANGMYIYNITNPDQPQQMSLFTHVESCDPVIADNDHAYVTLRSGTVCNGTANELEVLDITNITQPSLIKTYQMTHPLGLSKDDDLLFVCDDTDGLKVYDAANPNDLQLLKTITGLQTYDVIAYNGLAIVVAKDGLYQFDYSDRNHITQLSKLTMN